MRRLMFILLLLVIVSLPTAAAQDEPTCDIPTLTETYAAQLAEATTLEEVIAVQTALSKEIAVCGGLYFEGDAEEVFGPLEIPAGIYRGTVTTEGYFGLQITVLEGECDDSLIHQVSSGRGVEGSEFVYESAGCTAVLEVSNITTPYTLQFELLQ